MANFADLLLLLRADGTQVTSVLDDVSGQIKGLADHAIEYGSKLAEGLAFTELAKSAFDAGEVVETAMTKIERATGAVGDDLHGLDESFISSLGNLVQPANDVAGALALLSQRTGATGPELTDLLEINSKLAQVLDQQLRPTIEGTQKVFSAFGTTVAEQPAILDALLAVAQKSGANFNTLVSSLIQVGPTLRAMGLDVKDSAALLANLETHGENVSRVAATLNSSLVTLAKEGFSDPKAKLGELLQQIIDAKDPTEALQLAAENFKGKGLIPLSDALQNGAANLAVLRDAADNSQGKIAETAEKTQTLSDKFALLEGATTKLLAPIGVELVAALGHLVDAGAGVVNFIDKVRQKADELDNKFGTSAEHIQAFHDLFVITADVIAKKMVPELQELSDQADTNKFLDGTMAKGLSTLAGMFPGLGKGAGDARDQTKALNDELTAAEKNLSDVEKAVRMGVGTDEDAAAARQKVLAVMQALHPEFKNIFADTDEWNSAMAAGNALIGDQADDLVRTAPTVSAYTSLLNAQAISLKARADLWPIDMAGIEGQAAALSASSPALSAAVVDMTALDKIIKASQGDIKIQSEAIKQQTQSLGPLHDEMLLGIQDQGGLNSKMGEAHDAFLRVTAATDAQGNSLYSLHQQNVAQLADVDAQIAAYQNAGISTDALQLKAMHLADAIHTQNVGFTDTVTAIHGITTSGLDTALDNLITGAGSVADAFEKTGESIATTFANRILNDALKPVENELDTLVDKALKAGEKLLGLNVPGVSVPTLNGSTPPFIPSTPGLPDGVYTPGIPDLPPVAGPPEGIPGVNGAPGTDLGSTATGAISSSLTGMVTAIGSVVSAITGVIGVFQSAHQETSLNAIEQNTRITAIAMLGAWQTAGGDSETMFAFTKTTSQYAAHLPPMRGDLDLIAASAQGIQANTRGIGLPPPTDFAPVTGALASILGTLKDTLSFNWGTLHADLVGIWNAVGALNKPTQQTTSIQGNVYLDGQELWASFVTYLEQSGTKVPAA